MIHRTNFLLGHTAWSRVNYTEPRSIKQEEFTLCAINQSIVPKLCAHFGLMIIRPLCNAQHSMCAFCVRYLESKEI